MEQDLYQAKLTLVIVDKICASASIIGSTFIARDILKKWRNKKANETLPPTLYLLAHTSIADIGYSFWAHFLGSWPTPRDIGYPLAIGNDASCAAQGYLTIFFLVVCGMFRCVLAITYWLIVCRQKLESELRSRRWRFFLYCLSWAAGLIFAGISWRILPPSESTMSWAYCMVVFGEPGSTVPVQGSFGFLLWGIVGALYSMAVLTIVFCCMASLIRYVYQTERRMDRYRSKTVTAARTGLLYTIAQQFLLVPIIVYCILVAILNRNMQNWAWTLISCMKTLPGFLHSFIYFQPKYAFMRKQEGVSRLKALSRALDITAPISMPSTLSPSGDNCIRSGSGPAPSYLNCSAATENGPRVGICIDDSATTENNGHSVGICIDDTVQSTLHKSTLQSSMESNVCEKLGLEEEAVIEKLVDSTVPVLK